MAPEADAALDELAELRRRAYGPEGDIGGDAVALARLDELEQAVRTQHVSSTSAVAPPAAESPASADPPAVDAESPDDDGDDSAATAPQDPEPTAETAAAASVDSRGARLRARLPWAIAAASAVIAVIAMAVLVSEQLSRPRPEFSFAVGQAPDGTQRPLLDNEMRNYWGIPRSALEYRGTVGVIDVWTMVGDEGVACIFFSRRGVFWGQDCAVRPLSPLVEFRTSEDAIPADSVAPLVPSGSFIRFAWEGDFVNVYIVRDDDVEAEPRPNSVRAS